MSQNVFQLDAPFYELLILPGLRTWNGINFVSTCVCFWYEEVLVVLSFSLYSLTSFLHLPFCLHILS